MSHAIETVDGVAAVEAVGCDGCAAGNVRIATSGIAYEANRRGTWVRHNCGCTGAA